MITGTKAEDTQSKSPFQNKRFESTVTGTKDADMQSTLHFKKEKKKQ